MMTELITLTAIERRVLGVLMEKSMAQPDYYPMTLNALVAGCNQKQNRDPIMEISEDEVFNALETMRERNLVTMVLPAPGARTKRYRHQVEVGFGWQPRERAVMAELLLRGPQTVGELRTRCSRFLPFDGIESVVLVIDCLIKRDPAPIAVLPRSPGQSAERYTHLLYPKDERQSVTREQSVHPAPRSMPQMDGRDEQISGSELENIQAELAELQQTVAALTARIENIKRRIG